MGKGDDESFLGRWSRLKRQDGPDTGSTKADIASSAVKSPEVPGETETPFDPASLPNIDDLTASSDVSVFLRKGVPEHLKRLAMRRAWSLDPAIRDFVEMAENQYDWNVPGGVPGFGEIEPGTDMKALLAQAIGHAKQSQAGVEGSDATAAASSGESGLEGSVRAASTDVASGDPARDFERPLDELEKPAASAVVASENEASAPPEPVTRQGRRHGGALPQFPDDRT